MNRAEPSAVRGPASTEAAHRSAPLRAATAPLRAAGSMSPAALARRALRAGPGAPVDPGLRERVSGRLGHDLADVRIHEGPAVRAAALGLGAQAFTVGREIGLATPASVPTGAPAGSPDVRAAVVAHELTHVVQQSDGRLAIGDPGAAERAADRLGAGGRPPAATPGAGPATGPAVASVGRPVELALSVADWLRTTPNVQAWSRVQLQQELAEIEGWLALSTGGDLDSMRVLEGRQLVMSEIARRDAGAGEPRTPPVPAASAAPAAAPTTPAAAERESPGVLGTIGGALMGEWEEDPTIGMIAIDTGVSLIPIVDQIADVRDVVAHLYWMIERGQYNRVMRWIGLVFSLIGAVPEIGTAIKGVSKFLLKGVREALSHLDEILGITRRLLPQGGDLRRLMAFIRRHWDSWKATGSGVWNRVLDRVNGLLDTLWGRIVPGRARLLAGLANVRRRSVEMLPRTFDQVLTMIDAGMERLLRAVGLDPAALRRALGTEAGELATEGGARVPGRLADEGTEAAGGASHMASSTGPVGAPAAPGTPGHVAPAAPPPSGPVSAASLPPSHRAGSLDPEVAGGFARAHVRALGSMLGVSFDTPGLRRLEDIWLHVTNPADLAALTLSNSRRLFNNHRQRFWGAVQDALSTDAALRNMFTAAGLQFGRRGTAPYYLRTLGRRARVTIDHIIERQTAPGRALDPTNLRLSLTRENTVLLRLINALDPFQGARIERRASRAEAADIEQGIDDLIRGWIDVP